ncbi:uncharacterized protein LOC131953991 [Physella acuta]|uniref:uncharacterized protein LOC131953991 n=1 Tax=Physella acuta TaxID=109671 RepID=UPI0027DDA828|nr:uncharacterized protein LOC131953991 [Physella acuta]
MQFNANLAKYYVFVFLVLMCEKCARGDRNQCKSQENGDCKGLEKINLLLVGKTGAGKSTTGNTILRQTVFKTSSSATSATKEIQSGSSEYKGYVFKVVDTPGVFDTEMSQEELGEILVTSMSASPEGYHALLLVVPFGHRFTKEDEGTVETLKDIYGEETVEKNIILVVTRGDSFNPKDEGVSDFNEWCVKQTGSFRRLLRECSRRVVLFDNKTKDKKVIDRQIDELIGLVHQIKKSYSKDDFKKYNLRSKSFKAMKNVYEDFKSIGQNYDSNQLPKLEHLKEEAQTLEDILVENIETDIELAELLKKCKQLIKYISHAIESAKENTPSNTGLVVPFIGYVWDLVKSLFKYFFG